MHDQYLSAGSFSPSLLTSVRSLTSRHVRDASRRFWLEGFRHFIQACDAGVKFETIVYSRVLCSNSMVDMLVRRQKHAGVRVAALSPEQFRRISGTARASGIGAIAKQTWTSLSQTDPHAGLGWLVIEELRSPGNLGTILRTAEAVGMSGVIFLSPHTDPFDPDVIRSSMGGIFGLRMVRTSHRTLRHWCTRHGIRIVALSPDGEAPWNSLPGGHIALILGEERRGVSAGACAIRDAAVRLPMRGTADSLNVAVAAGVMMYELVRRS
jgi:TrmH family RNA methyltransferase